MQFGCPNFLSTSKRCNSNDTISMFEMFTRELHTTFLRTTTRGRKEPQQKATPRRHPPSPATAKTARSTGALHPIRVHYTRSEEVHCLRIGCSTPTHKNKRGTGKPSHSWPTTSPGAGRRASNDDPVSVGSVPSPRPRYPRYRSECPVRRCDRLRCRRPGPYQ